MPRKTKAQKRKPKEQATPRVRPLEALLRQGDPEGYDEILKEIALDGPRLHPLGSTIQHGRWKNGQEEWVPEKFRMTQDTMDNILGKLGISDGVHADSYPAENSLKPDGTPTKQEPAPDMDPEAARQLTMMQDLRSRIITIGMLIGIPGVERQVIVESIAPQLSRILEIIGDGDRTPNSEEPDLPPWEDDIQGMTRMAERISQQGRVSELLALDCIESIPGWMIRTERRLSEHTIRLESGARGWIKIEGGANGNITCTMLTEHPLGDDAECPWPACLGPDPSNCLHTGRSWRECSLPNRDDMQQRVKHFAAKREDLFPWPPEQEMENPKK